MEAVLKKNMLKGTKNTQTFQSSIFAKKKPLKTLDKHAGDPFLFDKN